jgi:hypothetical protein
VSGKVDYTEPEWALLSELPLKVAIGASIIETDDERMGASEREMLAAMKELAGAEVEYPDNQLIQAVLLELKVEDGEEGGSREIEIPGGEAWTELIDALLAQCREASNLLARHSSAQEVDEYKRWLLAIATKAVKAAESGGFLGIGGEQVSDQEQTFVKELQTALGLTA